MTMQVKEGQSDKTFYSSIAQNSQKPDTAKIIKSFSIKMEKDVGTSKPKNHANKVGRLT